ncbi:hypothetical protein CRI70_30055 [Streptomyces sp. Ru87]|nr:hypothetical protein CRI70_30055 [Streptomyces sp. Ru87]
MSIQPRLDSTHSAMCGSFSGQSALLSPTSWPQVKVSNPHSHIAWIVGASCSSICACRSPTRTRTVGWVPS